MGTKEEQIAEYLALFRGRPRLEQLEMALALSERVLTGKDAAYDRQIQAAAASHMWRDLGEVDLMKIDPREAARRGWARVASLAAQETAEGHAFLTRAGAAMEAIGQDEPVDIEVAAGAATRVYRFQAGSVRLSIASVVDAAGFTREPNGEEEPTDRLSSAA